MDAVDKIHHHLGSEYTSAASAGVLKMHVYVIAFCCHLWAVSEI